ncbi:MAG: dTDP-4-dehydrorhamnose 3,5-epimerase family protein, partial [Pseudomonadota bacterium]
SPHAEAKLVRAIRGRAYDVVVDLRPGATQGKWIAEELSATHMNALFLPEGVAHGFLTLEPETDILYQMDRIYIPGHADGLPWDDSDLAVDWPEKPEVLSEKDSAWTAWADRHDLNAAVNAP